MKIRVLWFLTCLAWTADAATDEYYGKSLGKLSEFHHGVSGHVYAVDGRTLFIKGFTYDGQGPAAYFYVGNSKAPNNNGAIRLRDERGSSGVLKRYRGKDITLSLPEGKTFHQLKWFSVWCDEFSVNFGDVKFPRNLDYPKPQKISALSGVHGVSSDPIVIVDAQTLLIPNFSYDGEAPDAKFWVGKGDKPSPQGIRIPDENGIVTPLRRYDHKTIVLTLPSDLTIFDIGHFGVWCEAFTVDFGHIKIPEITNVPPSLKMLGVSPQSKLNCEVLYDDLAFEVRWAVAGESVVIQLVAKLEDGEYMSFGISGDENHTQMVGSDVTVAWVDKATLKGYAYDYYLDAKSQCAGTRGSCPDDRIAEKTNSVRLLNAAMVNGYSIVTYQRPLRAADDLDKAVRSDKPQPIVWAVGPLNSRQEVSYHTHFTKGDRFLDFGRAPGWNCPMPEMDEAIMEDLKPPASRKPVKNNNAQFHVETTKSGFSDRGNNKFGSDDYDSDISETTGYKDQVTRTVSRPVPTPKSVPKTDAWFIPPINCNEPDDGVFYAQMGPTGGKHGYSAITGHVGWGISWYINGLLIPEINVVRGKTYTFVTEGGNDPSIPARYHPFYITDDSVGGYEHKTPEERANINVYAGLRKNRNGDIIPDGIGRLCNWTPDNNGPEADEFGSFGAYQRTLTLVCDKGEPGFITWTPDRNTPDTVYYQCFTHRYLGWKINVLDSCEETGEESKRHEIYSKPDLSEDLATDDDLVSRPSIRVNTRVKPDMNFIANQIKDSNKTVETKLHLNNLENHNMNGPVDNRVIIREIGNIQDDILTGEILNPPPQSENFANSMKKVSPEFNPRPDYDFPLTKNQFMQVIDTVERYETNMRNSHEDIIDRHPVYYHGPNPNQRESQANNVLNSPIRGKDEFKMEMKNIPTHMVMPNNQKPMTLQTFMRPHGKPMMPTNIIYRRTPPDMRVRRPGMQKPIIGAAPRLPPPMFMMGQSPYMSSQKKNFYKTPSMNRAPVNNNVGRPPILMPPKHNVNNMNSPKPVFPNLPATTKMPPQSVIMGKPNLMSQTLTLGQPTIIGQQIVRSQMTIPASAVDNTLQQTITNTYLNKPGQIIMGKPMDHPLPLDQQMIQTNQHMHYAPSPEKYNPPSVKFESVKPVYEIETTSKSSNLPANMTPSELISSSPDPNENLVTMKPAVNTGFRPSSIVIEGGFKPIIREPLLSGEDRITDYDSDTPTNNRRNDVDRKESEQVEETVNRVVNDNFYEKQLTESFEPMFIPSPPDRHFLAKNSSEGNKLYQYVDIRPRPVYIKPTEIETTLLDKEADVDKKIPDDMTMAADRVDAFYLPPDQPKPIDPLVSNIKLPSGTVVSYDGHAISDSTLTSSVPKNVGNKLYSAKLTSVSELLTKTPQFGPFRGEIPGLIQGQINAGPITKLKSVTNSHAYPGPMYKSEDKTSSKITKLSLVNADDDDDDDEKSVLDDSEYDASELEELFEKIDYDSEKNSTNTERVKRSAHHTPEHTASMMAMNNTDHSSHDHSQHDHSSHDHSSHSHQSYNSSSNMNSYSKIVMTLPIISVILVNKN